MKKEHEHINTLLERFFDGLTSNDEERELYRFFKQDDIPEAFAQYSPVIKYLSDGLARELEPSLTSHSRSDGSAVVSTARRKRWIKWGSIAASFLFIVFTSLYFLRTEADPFEGSYIIRNGVKITDLDLIRPELEATIEKVMKQQQEKEQLILPENSVEMQIFQQMLAHYQRILDNIQDEAIKNEVAGILYTNY